MNSRIYNFRKNRRLYFIIIFIYKFYIFPRYRVPYTVKQFAKPLCLCKHFDGDV